MLTSIVEKFNAKDEVYRRKSGIINDFEFNSIVAECFDDMVTRSIPFYDEIHKIIIDLVNRYYIENELIYDLGCSTGTTPYLINKQLKENNIKHNITGIDSSSAMIKKASEKLAHCSSSVSLFTNDITKQSLSKSQIIIMNYTLQFIEQNQRLDLLKKIYNSLNSGGIFILSEKIISSDNAVNNLITDLYYDFKRRNGYSELEIARKREALENILVPISSEEQIALMKEAGFKKVDTIFRWYNFACFLGIK